MDALTREAVRAREEALREKDRQLAAQREEIDELQNRLRDGAAASPPPLYVDPPRLVMDDDDKTPRQESLQASLVTSPVTSPISTLDNTVLQIVRTLNFEISEVASRVTNTFRVAETPEPLKVAAAFERAREAVGPVMAELLESIHHQEDPILIDIALKADMVAFVAEMVCSWDFQPQSRSVFAGAYRELRRSESQRTAAEWRARARKYSKRKLYNGRDLAGDFAAQLAERVADLLTLAHGAVPPPPALYAAHAGHVDAVVRAALDLQRLAGEDVLAADYEVHVVRIDEAFDGARMEDIYHGEIGAAGPPGTVPRVLATVDLGLRRTVKVEGAGEGDGITTMMLLKPQVVLDTIVYELGLVDEDEVAGAAPVPSV
ncbi:uncharacterized protein BXZ73DRAFT_88817 [Epithele typhae]|uniref:uncharacterized protein n=1 Tax=Epithele typhae TaxID=378194 RepID=UPI0020086235|nr:uncharacterized protein BXZ73DRAFT_88817 [Epithele typhae]KAH9940098.1 hypothetical protein BXZ73DRAFT_88817 [Epithele typhae]